MKNSLSKIEQRRKTIADFLAKESNQTLDVNELAERMNVSTMTIRRDLDVMEQMGKVVRNHGSATLNEYQREEGYTENDSLEKIKIQLAKQASTYIEEGMTLFINSSSTALQTVDFLKEKIVTLITNNLQVNRYEINPQSTVILSGGEIRLPKEVLVGDLCVTNFSQIYSDLTIIGCSGISAATGITTINIHESKVNHVMIHNTNGLVIVVCDYRKIGVDSKFIVSEIEKIDLLITDIYANPSMLREIEAKGVTVVQVAF
ncbi:DeoR/GlpR family DNA-binding transcription regulator [Enterococcus sp. LJL98]